MGRTVCTDGRTDRFQQAEPHHMPIPPLSAEDAAAFAATKGPLREKIPELAKYPDDFIWRFLKARKYDLDQTCKMIIDWFTWRREERIDSVTEENFPADCSKLYPCGYHGRDKRGNYIRVERPGQSSPGDAFDKYSMDVALRWHVCVMETGRKTFESMLGGTGDGVVVIMDLSGFGVKHFNKQSMRFSKTVAALDYACYPEFLREVYVVNAPTAFGGAWKILSHLMDANTRSKIQVLGKDYMQTLSQHVDPAQLPNFLGGGCRYCPNGCLSSVTFGSPDPAKPYLRIASRFSKTASKDDDSSPSPAP
eukprot:NODE_1041_length_1030_cov_452.697248_g865_i0.p1 GENE.NODE_1041_length_1030_cov_452.697248_g865_i0~~NODE_1041_length_1030_cov_452.697248_g865_i0.p1  ORF type:complete len:307 (-),score=55.66 NODE_1041_length_1030_cov_452.697248_g865_i0:78-998(-)